MDLVLQIWGGLFYLTNKICFALAEGKEKNSNRRLKNFWLDHIYPWGSSMGTLMIIQNKPILAFQQAVSLCFVVYGFITAIKVGRGHNAHKTIN